MNRIAKKRIAIVLAVIGAGGVGTGGLYAWRKQRLATHFRDVRAEGMTAAAANNYPLAVADLQEYLGRYNDDVEALATYCRVRPMVPSPDRSHLRATMSALRYYVSLRPDAVEQRRELLKLYLTYNQNTEALDTADRLLAKEPANAELLAAKTRALTRLRRTSEALATAKQWTATAPLDAEAQQYRVELLKQSGVDDAAILKDVDGLIAAHPDSVGLRLARADALMQANRIEDARATLKAAAGLPSSDPANDRALAGMMDRVGLFDESVALLTKLAQGPAPADGSGNENLQFLAKRLWERGDGPGFLALVDRHPELLDDAPDLLAIHGLLLRNEGKTAAGDADLAKLKADTADPLAKAWASVASGTNGPLTVKVATSQIDFVNDALIDRPNDAYLLYFLGEAYAQTGDRELAVSLWQRSARNAPAWPVPLMRASEVLAQQSRFDEAYTLAAMAAARSQRIALANYIQIWTAAVESGQRIDGVELLSLIDRAIAQTTGQGWLHVARATVLCRLGRIDEARQAIEAELNDDKAKLDQTSLLRLAALSRINKLNLDGSIEGRLNADFGVTADSAMTSFYRIFLSTGKDAAMDAFDKLRRAAPDAQSREWMLADAKVRDFVHDPKGVQAAVDAWHTLLAAHPDDVQVIQAALTSPALWKNDRPKIKDLIDTLQKLSGDSGLSWRLNLARWLLEGSADPASTQRASDLLTAVLTATPDNVAARFYQARAQAQLGNTGSAIENLMTATRLAPRSGQIALYAAKLLEEQGDFVRAREQIDRLSSQDLADPEQNIAAATLLAQQGKAQQAIDMLEQARSLTTADETDLPLALLYERQGEYEKAEAIISRLLQHPSQASIVLAADFFGSRGKADVAEQTLQKLYSLPLEPGVREMTFADYHLRRGETDKAETFSEAATVAAPQNAAAWKGLILAQLQGKKNDAATATLDRAIKAIPTDQTLLQLHDPSLWPLIAQVEDDLFRPLAICLVGNPADKAIRQALVLLRESKGAVTPALVDSMRQLAISSPHSEPLQVVTGELLLDAHQDAAATELATRGVLAFPMDGALPKIAARAFLESHQWSQAKLFAASWRKQAAGSDLLAADLLAALASLKMGNPADSEALLRPHVAFAMDRLDQHADVIRAFATALYLQDKSSEGEQVVEQAIARKSAFGPDWLATVGSELPTSDALLWLKKIEPGLSDGQGKTLGARIWLQLAIRPDAPPEAMPTLRQRLEELEARTDLSGESTAILGIIADQIGDADRAERFYRRSLATGGVDVAVVCNNLAMLLLGQNRQLDEAETLAAKAIAAESTTAVYDDTSAQVLLAEKKVPEAREAIDRAIKLDSDNLAWQLTSAEVMAAAGQVDKAQAVLNGVLAGLNTRQMLGASETRRAEALRAKLAAAKATG